MTQNVPSRGAGGRLMNLATGRFRPKVRNSSAKTGGRKYPGRLHTLSSGRTRHSQLEDGGRTRNSFHCLKKAATAQQQRSLVLNKRAGLYGPAGMQGSILDSSARTDTGSCRPRLPFHRHPLLDSSASVYIGKSNKRLGSP